MANPVQRYRELADYNAWANARIYDAARTLSPSDYHADLGAFFHSVCGTLNHILVADRIWLSRLHGEPQPSDPLNTILHTDIEALWTARRGADTRFISFVTDLSPGDLGNRLSYRPIGNPRTIEQPVWSVLDHVFNHQTHHRGQAHALLTRLGAIVASLDLIQYQRDVGAGDVVIGP